MASKDRNVHQLATGAFHKLVPHSTGSFGVINFQTHTVTIYENVIENKVTIDRVVHTPNIPRQQYTGRNPFSCNPNDGSRHAQTKPKRSDDHAAIPENVVYRIVRYVGTGSDTKYVVQWYEFMTANDTLELSEHIPQHLISVN